MILILNMFSLILFVAKVLYYLVIEQANEESLFYSYLHIWLPRFKAKTGISRPICPKKYIQSGLDFAMRILYKKFSVILKELKESDIEYVKR